MEPPKMLRRIEKLLNDSMCKDVSVYASSSRSRLTMGPSSFVSSNNVTKASGIDRSSVSQSQLNKYCSEEVTKMELLYNEYLQGLMVELILKQKIQEKEKLIVSQLASITKEINHNKEILFKLKTRERDIRELSNLQNEIDLLTEDMKSYIKSEDIKEVENVLSRLHIVLQDCDVLRCDNIILPKTLTEWEELNQTLKSCCNTLRSLTNRIGSHNESYQCTNDKIKDFLNTYKTIEDLYKRLEKDINKLQALALKTAALSLT